MKTKALLLLGSLIGTTAAHAQWLTTTYALKGGWNAIYLNGDATWDTITAVLPNTSIEQVWRWNPNPNQVQFTASPLVPVNGTPEWTKWARGDADTWRLSGQTAYLVKCVDAAAPFNIALKQSPLPPAAIWVRAGANLLGFPSLKTGAAYPPFSNYFATFPAAIAPNTKIFKYVGGALSPVNPLQVLNPASEQVDATQAYWFSAEVVGDYYAPLDVKLSMTGGLDFGRTGSNITALVRNRTSATMVVTLSTAPSETAPGGAETLTSGTNNAGLPTGNVPLTRRAIDTGVETLILTPYTETIGPGATVELSFGIQRPAMTAATPGALYGSMLRLRDGTGLADVVLPVKARKTSLSGLWIGEAIVKAVESKAAADAITPVARPYPLRYILHVADDGTTRVLSQVFMGKLSTVGNPVGLCTKEAGLMASDKANARRLSAVHLPLDRVLDGNPATVPAIPNDATDIGTGSVALGSTLVRKLTIPFNDPVNPFVHKFHPDHDNKSPAGAALVAGQESHTVERNVSFAFTAAPPDGSPTPGGWGSTLLGGTYEEVINGLHKDSAGVGTGNGLKITGTFELRRASELGTITVNP